MEGKRGEMYKVEVIVFRVPASSLICHGPWDRGQPPPSVRAQKGRHDRRQLVRLKKGPELSVDVPRLQPEFCLF